MDGMRCKDSSLPWPRCSRRRRPARVVRWWAAPKEGGAVVVLRRAFRRPWRWVSRLASASSRRLFLPSLARMARVERIAGTAMARRLRSASASCRRRLAADAAPPWCRRAATAAWLATGRSVPAAKETIAVPARWRATARQRVAAWRTAQAARQSHSPVCATGRPMMDCNSACRVLLPQAAAWRTVSADLPVWKPAEGLGQRLPDLRPASPHPFGRGQYFPTGKIDDSWSVLVEMINCLKQC